MKTRTQPSYRSNYTFLKLVDKLPTGPEWACRLVQVHGDIEPVDNNLDNDLMGDNSEQLELWMRDPVTCVRELIGNPAFDGRMAYIPERVYTDPEGQTCRYDEMWTADWWCKTQVSSVLLII